MQTLAELRAALAPLGFTVKTKSLSWGPHATYEHKATKARLTGNVFTPETLATWQPLFDWLRAHRPELEQLRTATGIFGLKYV